LPIHNNSSFAHERQNILVTGGTRAAPQLCVDVAPNWKGAGELRERSTCVACCLARKSDVQLLRKTHHDTVPMKPQQAYPCMNNAFGKDAPYISAIGRSQIAGAQFLHLHHPHHPHHWITCGQAGPLG
jgi:tartronate-semialdehyde synthase